MLFCAGAVHNTVIGSRRPLFPGRTARRRPRLLVAIPRVAPAPLAGAGTHAFKSPCQEKGMARLPKAPFEKILKESAKDIRVSDAAAKALSDLMLEISKELAADASEIARHANRKTVLDVDVKLAFKMRKK